MTELPDDPSLDQSKLPVFISWSQSLAESVGKILRDWLLSVVPGVRPWYSPDDIETGKFWQLELFKSLDRSSVGIVIVTPSNLNRPWVSFEAGHLASKIEGKGGVVMPLLLNLEMADITGHPLASLNAVTFSRAGLWKIVKAIHARTGIDMTEQMLESLFTLSWPGLESDVRAAIARAEHTDAANQKPQQRATSAVLEDLVVAVGDLRNHVRTLSPNVKSKLGINVEDVLKPVREILAEECPDVTVHKDIDIFSNGSIQLLVSGDTSTAAFARARNRIYAIPRFYWKVFTIEFENEGSPGYSLTIEPDPGSPPAVPESAETPA